MSVEKVDLIQILVVETLVWEVLLVAIHLELDYLTNNFSFDNIIDKMIVCERKVMEKSYKYLLIRYKTADNVRIWEILNRHGPVINPNQGIDIQLVVLNLLLSSGDLTKVSEHPLAIIEIHQRILVSSAILLNLLHLNIVRVLSSDLLLKGKLIAL